jgi:hypothetical protein
LNKKECYAYNVPPATSASGYKAADWGNCIWKGKLQVCAKGEILVIKLLDSSGKIFAACPLPPGVAIDKVVERTVDSSRYFVLTMSDKSGRKAHLGMGFDDRNDAFDFNATIQDYRRQNDAPKDTIKPFASAAAAPVPDRSLKQGDRIEVQLKGLVPPPSNQSGPVVLPPPPVAARSRGSVDTCGSGGESAVPPSSTNSVQFQGSLLD